MGARWLAVMVLVLVAASCMLPARRLETRIEANGPIAGLSVVVEDHTGLVLSVAPAVPQRDGIENLRGRPDVLVVTWLGGMCDQSTTFVLRQVGDGFEVAGQTLQDPGPCRLSGVTRSIGIHLAVPVAARTVALTGVP